MRTPLTRLAAVVVAVLSSAATLFAFDSKKPFDISADVIDYVDVGQELTAEGNVLVIQGSSTITADYMRYERVVGRIVARGRVILRDKGKILTGDELTYDLVKEEAHLVSAQGVTSPWRFQGQTWDKKQDYYIGRQASFTSCQLPDAHFHFRSSRVHLVPDRIFWAWNNRFYVDRMPFLYSPFLYKDLDKKRVVFQVQPGHDSVSGSFAKTQTTIRFTDDIYNKFLFDHYSIAGNGVGDELNYRHKDKLKGSLLGYYINPHANPDLTGAPTAPQYTLRAYHWQNLGNGLTAQANGNLRRNVSFNNQYFQQDINQSVNDITSSLALTKASSRLNQRLVVERLDSPDPGDSRLFAETHMQTASLPRYELTMYQTPLWSPPKVSTTSVSGRPVIPKERIGPLLLTYTGSAGLFYQRGDDRTRLKINNNATLSESIPLGRFFSFTPTLTPSLNWQDKGDAPSVATVFITTTGVVRATTTVASENQFHGFQARLGTAETLRFRPFSSLTLDQTYSLTQRFEPNRLKLDRSRTDDGIESHRLSWFLYWRPSRLILLRSFSGYDLRQVNDESLLAYHQRKWDPWNAELTFQPRRAPLDVFVRHTLAFYPFRTSLWEASVAYRGLHRTHLETGLLYNRGQAGLLTWNNRIGYFLSPGWRIDGVFHALVPNTSLAGLNRTGKMIDSEILVRRDLHCWAATFIFRDRPPFSREYSLLFSLKLGTRQAQPIGDQDLESQFYPWRAYPYAR